MNLPEVNERTIIVQKAEDLITSKFWEVKNQYKELNIGLTISAISQIIINLTTRIDTIINDIQKDFENVIKEVSLSHNLTYGEIVKILSLMIAEDAKYVIRFERKNEA